MGSTAAHLGQVDDADGAEGAAVHADATADAQRLGDEGGLGGRRHLDALLACASQRVRKCEAAAAGLALAAANAPIRTTGHDLRHSWRHFLGLHCAVGRSACRQVRGCGPEARNDCPGACLRRGSACMAHLVIADNCNAEFLVGRRSHGLDLWPAGELQGGHGVHPQNSETLRWSVASSGRARPAAQGVWGCRWVHLCGGEKSERNSASQTGISAPRCCMLCVW